MVKYPFIGKTDKSSCQIKFMSVNFDPQKKKKKKKKKKPYAFKCILKIVMTHPALHRLLSNQMLSRMFSPQNHLQLQIMIHVCNN